MGSDQSKIPASMKGDVEIRKNRTTDAQKDICPLGARLQPYWDVRDRLFSRFDDGVKFDKEGLYSAKPEKSAQGIADLIKGNIIVDAFGGIGGSSIAFALSGKEVFYVDTNPVRLKYAKHNAKLYEVSDKIEFILGNCLDMVPQLNYDSLYCDPPWVGEEFFTDRRIIPRKLTNNGKKLITLAKNAKSLIGFTVPNNFDYNQILSFENDFYVKTDFLMERMIYSTFFIDFRAR